MKNLFNYKLLLSLVAIIFLSISCKKENTDVIEETYEDLQISFLVTIDGETQEYNSYASYCNENGTEVLQLGTNLELLETDLNTAIFEMEVDDFILLYTRNETQINTLSVTAYPIETGVEIILDPGAEIIIEEANQDYVIGSMSGNFELLGGELIEYSIEFTAEVVQVDPRCN